MKRKAFGTAKVVIVTVIDEEFDAICRLGGFATRCAGQYYVRAALADNNYDMVACRADGWGNLASGEAVADAIEDFSRPYFIILCGIAGGIVRPNERDPIKTGDVVVADYLHYSELKKLSKQTTSFRYKPHDHPSNLLRVSFADPLRQQSDRWRSLIQTAPPEPRTPKARIENLVTGDTLLGDPTNLYQQLVLQNYYSAVAVDMESMGVGREIFHQRRDPHYNPQFLIVRGISDLVEADERSKFRKWIASFGSGTRASVNQATRDAWRVYAAEAAAAFALTLAGDLLVYLSGTPAPGPAV
jgi:nucleoside phosphorylase